jgi:hypothetical protein
MAADQSGTEAPDVTPRVRQLLEDGCQTLAAGDDPGWQYWMGLFMASLWEHQYGSPVQANSVTSELALLGTRSGDPIIQAHAAEAFAFGSQLAEDSTSARTRLLEALGHHTETGFRLSCFAHCLDHISLWIVDQGQAERAATLLGSSEALRADHVGVSAPAFIRHWHEAAKQRAAEHLVAAAFEQSFAEGRRTEPERAAEIAYLVLEAA